MVTNKVTRYERPSVEVEFDQPTLTGAGCCRLVPVVLRICGIADNTMLTVMFERAKLLKESEQHTEDYEVHPDSSALRVSVLEAVKGYREYHGAFLARAHDKETGTIHIKLESGAFNVLTEATLRLDSRREKPVLTIAKGKLKDIRFLPQLRSQEERDALHGHYPSSALMKELPAEDGKKEQGGAVQEVTLFSLD